MGSREISQGLQSHNSDSEYSCDHRSLWKREEEDSSVSSVESSPYDVSRLEARLYYFGIGGSRHRGPIQHSSIDLVCFSWVEKKEDTDDIEDNKDVDINTKVAPYERVVTTPVTIWVGVLPDTLTGEVAPQSNATNPPQRKYRLVMWLIVNSNFLVNNILESAKNSLTGQTTVQ